jgi:arsenate reductase (thioredoxin)
LRRNVPSNTAFRYLKNRISVFTNLPIRSLDRMALSARLREIGRLEGPTAMAKGQDPATKKAS